MKQTRTAGGVVLNRRNQVLVVSQNGDSWSLPKGHVDPGEGALEAAQREIYEESGIRRLSLVKELGTYKRPKIALGGGDDPSEMKTITLFLFKTDEEKLAPVDSKNPEARWLEPDQALDILTHEKDREFLRRTLPEVFKK